MLLNWLTEFLIHFKSLLVFSFIPERCDSCRFVCIQVQIFTRNPISYRLFTLFFYSCRKVRRENIFYGCIRTSVSIQSTMCFFAVQFALMSHIFRLWPILKIIATAIHCWVHENIMDVAALVRDPVENGLPKNHVPSFDNSFFFCFIVDAFLSIHLVGFDICESSVNPIEKWIESRKSCSMRNGTKTKKWEKHKLHNVFAM